MAQQDRRFKEAAGEIESLLDEIESIQNPELRDVAIGVVQDMMALYGEGLSRIMRVIREISPPADAARIMTALGDDELVSHILLLHDLHPVDLHTRVERALEDARPYLRSHGGNVELLGIEDGVATLRLEGSCHGCPGSAITLRSHIEQAIQKVAPDLDGVCTDGSEQSTPALDGFVPLGSVTPRKAVQSVA